MDEVQGSWKGRIRPHDILEVVFENVHAVRLCGFEASSDSTASVFCRSPRKMGIRCAWPPWYLPWLLEEHVHAIVVHISLARNPKSTLDTIQLMERDQVS